MFEMADFNEVPNADLDGSWYTMMELQDNELQPEETITDDEVTNNSEVIGEEDYIYMDEEDLKQTEHYNDVAAHHMPKDEDFSDEETGILYEPMETAEDGRIESAFEMIDNVAAVEMEEKLSKPHILQMRRNTTTDEEYYHCNQCHLDYETIEEFALDHPQEEALVFQDDGECDKEQHFEIVDNDEEPNDFKPSLEELQRTEEDIRASEAAEFLSVEQQVLEEVVYNEQFLEEQHDVEICEEQLQRVFIKQETQLESSNDDDSGSGDRYFCDECQKVFNDFQLAEEHECPAKESIKRTESVKNKGSFECSFCEARLKTLSGFHRHQLNCRLQPPLLQAPTTEFKCQTCYKILVSAKELKMHLRTHMEHDSCPDKIVCNICNTVFTSVKNLKLHRKIHEKKPIKSIQQALPAGAEVEYNELNQFFCEICNKSFDQNLLAVHKNMHQNVEEYNCSVCNKQFENMASYEMHMQLHTDKMQERRGQTKAERNGITLPFPCNYCGREFARPHEKVKHERIHTGEKPYECEVCGKTFRVSYSLTLHLRTHTDIRPYVCATCNKRFKSQPVYAHHLNTHLAERNYKCNLCPKTFRTSVQLCGHRNSHTKPFNCTECNRPFATLYAVKVHMKTHSKTNKANESFKHSCFVCGAVYARIFALRYHMKEQHALDLGNNSTEFDMQHTELNKDADGAIVNVMSSVDLDDEDAAVLIAAAAEASTDRGALAVSVDECFSRDQRHSHQVCYDEDAISTQTILQSEEIDVDNFHTEEIVTDWLIK